ncbi:MAG: histidinol dehydrogenase [Pseudomonadales bacterium]|nr:histidinol dehydrogenase [Pseudomonadales bacterium]
MLKGRLSFVRRLSSSSDDFAESLAALSIVDTEQHEDVQRVVKEILSNVRVRGDAAIKEYTAKFDKLQCTELSQLEISRSQTKSCYDGITTSERAALKAAAARIEHYHQQQNQSSWYYTDELGNRLGQKISAIERVGIYVPGGQAVYPSTVLMTAIPAKVAGVPELVMVVPTPVSEASALLFAAAYLAGVDRIFTIGGAQAVAGLAYGTETIPKVDKIVGPGNAFVTEAKRVVFGTVGIDLIAGPSEILIIADGSVEPEWLVMDMFSQAEHAPNAQSLMLCSDKKYLDRIEALIDKMLPDMARQPIISESLSRRGALIHTKNLEDAISISNSLAPEHLELAVNNADQLLDKIKHAGAIFCGAYSAEVLGDYAAGPSHVLPTFGAARFSSPLGVYDFQKRSSVIQCSEVGAAAIADISQTLASGEGLHAHAASAAYRKQP